MSLEAPPPERRGGAWVHRAGRGPRTLSIAFRRLPAPCAARCLVFIREPQPRARREADSRAGSGWSPCLVALWMNPLFAANLACQYFSPLFVGGTKGSLTIVKPLHMAFGVPSPPNLPHRRIPHRLLTTTGLSLTPCNGESSRKLWSGPGLHFPDP